MVSGTARPQSETRVTIRTHRIPSPNSEPYICVPGPDGHLWFCESGASTIGRLNVTDYTFAEFKLPVENAMPIGIAADNADNLWFCAKKANKVGRITVRGEI